MKISIKNFRRIQEAVIDTSKITLIAGRNGEGKTSTIQAIAAALAGNTVPVPGLKKQDSGVLVHTGFAAAEIIADNQIGTASVSYPGAKRATEGCPCEISAVAAGLTSFVDLSLADRSKFINELMHTEPSREELFDEIAKAIPGTKEGAADRIWQTIIAQGWDAAWKHARETGSKHKGAWEEITGDRYGSQKAETWVPPEWQTDLQDATEQSLTEAINHERQWLEAAISDQAVNAAEIERLRKAADMAPTLKQEIDDLVKTSEALTINDSDLQAALNALPPVAGQQKTQPCPHCSQPLVVSGGQLFKPAAAADPNQAENNKRRKETEAARQSVAEAIKRASDEIAKKRAQLDAANNATEKIKRFSAKPAATKDHPAVEDCRTRVKSAEDRLAAWTKQRNAAARHVSITKNQIIINILAPEGLRMARLKYALTEINKQLAAITAATGWERVEIEDDLSVSFGDYQYTLHSQSRQYLIRISLQMAFTIIDQSQVVLIDGADILDSPRRNGLFKMLTGFPGSAIVAMTISKATDIPPIEKLGGVAYWLENGTAQKVRG
jgi:hypothetical protein